MRERKEKERKETRKRYEFALDVENNLAFFLVLSFHYFRCSTGGLAEGKTPQGIVVVVVIVVFVFSFIFSKKEERRKEKEKGKSRREEKRRRHFKRSERRRKRERE